jgi:hypothetical protein
LSYRERLPDARRLFLKELVRVPPVFGGLVPSYVIKGKSDGETRTALLRKSFYVDLSFSMGNHE